MHTQKQWTHVLLQLGRMWRSGQHLNQAAMLTETRTNTSHTCCLFSNHSSTLALGWSRKAGKGACRPEVCWFHQYPAQRAHPFPLEHACNKYQKGNLWHIPNVQIMKLVIITREGDKMTIVTIQTVFAATQNNGGIIFSWHIAHTSFYYVHA